MSGYSFYGGKEGRTYNLVAHYDSVADMTTLFSQGGSYTDVNYNEYVIIDTIINDNNKTSPENGLLYRRGLNYTEEVKTAPNINDEKYHEIKTVIVDQETTTIEEFKQEVYEADFKNYIKAPGGGAIYVGQIVGPTGDSPSIELLNWSDFINKTSDDEITVLEKTDFIPNRPSGKEQNHAQYGYCNIADSNGNIIGAYLSFDFPYTVFEVSAESVSPYGPIIIDVEELPENPVRGIYYRYNEEVYTWKLNSDTSEIEWIIATDLYNAYYDEQTKTWSYDSLISEKEESKENVYYFSHDIKIPTGIKGDDITDLSIITPNEEDIEDGGFDNEGQWLAYKDRNYNASAEGAESDWKPLAPYKVISNITANPINENYEHPGELKVDYTYGESDTFDLRNVEKLELPLDENANNRSHLLVYYTDEDENTSHDLGTIKYVENIKFPQRGETGVTDNNRSRLYVNYSDDINTDIPLGTISYVDYIEMGGNDLHTIYYRLSTDGEIQPSNILGSIRHIVKIERDEDTGKYLVTYATGDNEEDPQEIGTIYGFKNIEYEDGQFIFTWDYKEEGSEEFKTDTFTLKVLDEIEVVNSYNVDIADATEYNQVKDVIPNELKRRVVTAKYEQNDTFNNEELYQINEVLDIKLQGDNIVVLYSDPEKRKNINESQAVYRDGYRWENLGPILNGNHIQGDFSSLAELQETYPDGFGTDSFTENRQGWIATVTIKSITPGEPDTIQLYAYDYNLDENNQPKGWYLIQELGADSVHPEYTMILEKSDSANINIPSKNEAVLNNKGFWFVLEEK